MSQNELKELAEKFLAASAPSKDKTSKVQPLEQGLPEGANVLVAVPCHQGLVQWRTVVSLMDLSALFREKKILFKIQFLAQESLITRARNFFANIAAFDTDESGRPWSHLLFVDSDIAFQPEEILRILQADKPIICLPCALKAINWRRVSEAVSRGVPAENLSEFAAFPVLHADGPFSINEVTPVSRAGTGIMLTKVEVLKAIDKAHRNRRYKSRLNETYGNPLTRDFAHEFFRAEICPKTNIYLSEDFWFCDQARRLGFQLSFYPRREQLTRVRTNLF